MSTEEVSKDNGQKDSQTLIEPELSVVTETVAIKPGRVFYWEKWASQLSNEDEDHIRTFEVVQSPKIREILRNLDSKLLGKKMAFLEEVRPKTSSVKRWIMDLKADYPNPNSKDVENILDTFRSSLHSKSKEAYKSIVCILLMDDVFLLLHCKKDPSLVIMDDKVYSVDQILSTKNVYRAAIIRNEAGKTTFSAYEYSKRWSKGHAEFWGVDPEGVSWDALGNITLIIELENFDYPMQLSIDAKELDLVFKSGRITPTGRVNIGHLTGRISKAKVFRTDMSFEDFYEFYFNEKEQLETHIKKFNELVPSQKDLPSFNDKYRYKEDLIKIYEMTATKEDTIHNKEHPTYNVFFFTKSYPGVVPSPKVVYSIYESIFNNTPMSIWHAGEESTNEPLDIGNLKIFNKMCDNPDVCRFSTNLLNIIQDGKSTKEYYLLQSVFCNFWKYNLKSKHFRYIFDFICEQIINPELEFSFKNKGILAKEEIIDFKSADEVVSKPSRFVNDKIMPMIKQYYKDGVLLRNCILFGFSDSGAIEPIYNIKSDQLSAIQDKVNEAIELEKIPIKVNVISIPYGEGTGRVIAMLLIPLF